MKFLIPFAITPLLLFGSSLASANDTFPPLTDQVAPSTLAEMWGNFDPRAEPLATKTLHEWEEDGVTLRVVQFHIGVFKGESATLVGIYGFPSSIEPSKKIPGLLQIHGGGQYADHKACVANAKRGYATLSIAWAGRISAPNYRVSPTEVQLFWDGKTGDPAYRITTDWGKVDGYHAPSRNKGNAFPSAKAHVWTLDEVESPRNSGWFLCAVAARRALTFLEQQPEVDAEKLGVYGHSMGGKLTVMSATDSRVNAAAPSCGGISDRDNESELFRSTVCDQNSLKEINCPIIFLSPANDFHGRIGDLPRAVKEIQSSDWRVTCSPHHNHQDTDPYEVATLLWMDQHLKRTFVFPKTPQSALVLKTDNGNPNLTLRPDDSKPVLSVDVFYTHHGKAQESQHDRDSVVNRHWHHVKAVEANGEWTASLELSSIDKPLWVYANVTYPLDPPVVGVGYYYGAYSANSFNVSSLLQTVTVADLQAAGVKVAKKHSLQIENFEGDWEKEWFTYRPNEWARSTHKLGDDAWKAPENAVLAIDVLSERANKLVVMLDEHAAEFELQGGTDWQTIQMSPHDFHNSGEESLLDWKNSKRLKLSPIEHLRSKGGKTSPRTKLGQPWQGNAPQFRNLRWEQTEDDSKQESKGNAILSVFPESQELVTKDRMGQTTFVSVFSPSGSVWDERLEESQVFHLEMQHKQDAEKSFRLRIGKGGQIYSLRGPFGESVPPSWRAPGNDLSPWNDEVWQFVAVCTKYNGTKSLEQAGELPKEIITKVENSGFRNSFFIHNSGAYIPGESNIQSLYCPQLASEIDQDDRCVRSVHWGLVPQLRTIHRSPLLFYSQVRDAGDGIIELTWVIHNFSQRDDIVFDHLNAPWGGTRVSSLPLHYISSPTGDLKTREEILNANGVTRFRKTGGWNVSCSAESDLSPSLALVYGRDQHLETEEAKKNAGKPHAQFAESLYRDWRQNQPAYKTYWSDWQTRPENSYRNYDVCEVIPKLQIAADSTIWYRSFLVVGGKSKTIEKAKSLVDKVDYGLLNFPAETTPLASVSIPGSDGTKSSSFQVFTQPVANTKPLLLIRNSKTGQQIVTTDPYYFVKKERLELGIPESHPHYDYYKDAVGYSIDQHDSEWISLVGYGYEAQPDPNATPGEWQRLSTILNKDKFPPTNAHHMDLWVKAEPQTAK